MSSWGRLLHRAGAATTHDNLVAAQRRQGPGRVVTGDYLPIPGMLEAARIKPVRQRLPPGCGRCEVARGRDGRCGLSTESRTGRVPAPRAVRPGNRRRATGPLCGREGIGLPAWKNFSSAARPNRPLPCALLAKLLPVAVQALELSEFTAAPALFHLSRPSKRGSESSRMNDSRGEFGTSEQLCCNWAQLDEGIRRIALRRVAEQVQAHPVQAGDEIVEHGSGDGWRDGKSPCACGHCFHARWHGRWSSRVWCLPPERGP